MFAFPAVGHRITMTDNFGSHSMSLHASQSNDTGGPWRIIASVLLASTMLASVAVAGAAGGPDPHLSADDRVGEDPSLLVIESASNETVQYRFTVDGSVESDEMDGGVVEGSVNGSDADAYRVSGSITGLVLAGNATLSLDGEEVSPANLSDGWAVTFADCSTVDVAGDFETGYGFSTVIFPVRLSDGTFVGFEEAMVNERLTVENGTASLQAGTTLPEDVSNVTALRSVFLYDEQVEASVDPLLVESEVTVLTGQPTVRVENPAHDACQQEIMDRLENETAGNATTSQSATGT